MLKRVKFYNNQAILFPLLMIISIGTITSCEDLFGDPEAELKYVKIVYTSDPNGDGIFSPGERIGFSIGFKNDGDTTAYDIEIVASSTSNLIQFVDDQYTASSMAEYSEREPRTSSDFTFDISSSAQPGTQISINLDATTSNGDGFSKTVSLTIEQADINLIFNDFRIAGSDGMISPGENARIYYSLQNTGHSPVDGVLSTATVNNPNVKSISGNLSDSFGNIDGQSVTVYRYYDLEIESSCPVTARIPVYFTIIDANQYTWIDSMEISINQGSKVEFNSYQISDATGNNDGVVNPGESITLQMLIENTGIIPAHGLRSIISTTDGSVTLSDGSFDGFGDLESGQTALSGFEYSFLVFVTHDSSPIEFVLEIEDNLNNSWTTYFSIPVL